LLFNNEITLYQFQLFHFSKKWSQTTSFFCSC